MEHPTRREVFLAAAGAFLSSIGAAIAGTLWWAHRQHIDLPCTGDGRGCDIVAQSRWSHLSLGPWHDVPVALAGFVLYLIMFSLCMAILASERIDSRHLLRGLLRLIVLIGFCFSWYLQYIAHVKIGAFCIWCFSSACVMTALLVAAVVPIHKSHEKETQG